MSFSVTLLEGMSPELAAKMRPLGIFNSDQLLAAARTPADRNELAQQLDISPEKVLELAHRADLSRIRGVAGVFSNLLAMAGVDTVKELASRNPENLFATLAKINAEQGLTGRPAYEGEVAGWIARAKALPPAIEY